MYRINQEKLRKAWEAGQRSTKDDWNEWMRRFSVELLRESPAPALRACSALAQVYQPLARELFNAAFVSCWTELDGEGYQEYLVRSLETVFSSPETPPEILQALLNLAEFMEPSIGGDWCQNGTLTAEGESLLMGMMSRGMIVEVDHFPQWAYRRAYELLEAYDYPAAGTHGRHWDGRIYALGGAGHNSGPKLDTVESIGPGETAWSNFRPPSSQ